MQDTQGPYVFISRASMSMVFVVLFQAASSADMIYRSTFQSISGSGTQLSTLERSSDAALPFSDDLLHTGDVRDESNKIVGSVSAFASLQSRLDAVQIGGKGHGIGFGTADSEGSGRAEMLIDFQIDEASDYTMAGQLRVTPFTLGLNGSWAELSLTGPEGEVFAIRLDEENQPDELGIVNFMGEDQFVGFLDKGAYQFRAITTGQGSGGMERCVDFNFTFATAAVPEPSAIWGIAWLIVLCCPRCRRFFS